MTDNAKTERFKMIASGYLMLIRGGKILLSRRFQTGYEDGKYSLPAGHIEDNETFTDGTCREIREEIGIALKPSDLRLVHVMHRKHFDIRMDFFFTTNKKGLKPKNFEPHKSDDVAWFPLTKLPNNTVPYIRAAIANYRKKIIYSEFGWE
jgi:ADP-ribose pyrophosphatase YjhB (NUDIX family)